MVPDLVDQDVADEVLEALALLDPLVEDRAAEEADAVGQGARMRRAALADRDALVDAGQVERMLDPHLGEQRLVGEVLDLEHDPAEVRRERLGQAGQSGARDRFDLVERRGMIEGARHGPRA